MLTCICHSLSLDGLSPSLAGLVQAPWIALRPARTTSSSPPVCPLTSALPAPSPTASTEAAAWARGWGVDLLSLPPSQSPLLTAAWGLFLEMPFVSWSPFSRLYPQPRVVLCLASWGSGLFSTLHVLRCSLVSHGMHTSVTVVTLCVCHPFVQQ